MDADERDLICKVVNLEDKIPLFERAKLIPSANIINTSSDIVSALSKLGFSHSPNRCNFRAADYSVLQSENLMTFCLK